MKILIDADGCPVINESLEVAREFGLEMLILCDTSHYIEREGAKTITVSKGIDAVDFVLINKVQEGDCVVTQDYGLAAMVLAKCGYAINQNGLIYTKNNIEELLFKRHLGKEVRRQGGKTKGAKKRDIKQNQHFKEALRQLIASISK